MTPEREAEIRETRRKSAEETYYFGDEEACRRIVSHVHVLNWRIDDLLAALDAERERNSRLRVEADTFRDAARFHAERNTRLAQAAEDLVSELEDIVSGDWRRYPNHERHRCATIEAFVEHALAEFRAGAGSGDTET